MSIRSVVRLEWQTPKLYKICYDFAWNHVCSPLHCLSRPDDFAFIRQRRKSMQISIWKFVHSICDRINGQKIHTKNSQNEINSIWLVFSLCSIHVACLHLLQLVWLCEPALRVLPITKLSRCFGYIWHGTFFSCVCVCCTGPKRNAANWLLYAAQTAAQQTWNTCSLYYCKSVTCTVYTQHFTYLA